MLKNSFPSCIGTAYYIRVASDTSLHSTSWKVLVWHLRISSTFASIQRHSVSTVIFSFVSHNIIYFFELRNYFNYILQFKELVFGFLSIIWNTGIFYWLKFCYTVLPVIIRLMLLLNIDLKGENSVIIMKTLFSQFLCL